MSYLLAGSGIPCLVLVEILFFLCCCFLCVGVQDYERGLVSKVW